MLGSTRQYRLIQTVLMIVCCVSLLLLFSFFERTNAKASDFSSEKSVSLSQTEEVIEAQLSSRSLMDDSSSVRKLASAAAVSQDVTGSLTLSKHQPEENETFYLDNMFPGDSETKRFRVLVSYRDTITLHFHAEIDSDLAELKDVLKCRVTLPDTGETLYDGLMAEMPASLNTTHKTTSQTTSEVVYAVSVSLGTDVGNDFMDKNLKADFKWWVEETENLTNPETGNFFEHSLFPLLLMLFCAIVFVLITVSLRKRKGGESHGQS